MKTKEISEILASLKDKLSKVKYPAIKTVIDAIFSVFLNLVERLVSEKAEQAIQIQGLKDEVNRLKGEQGKVEVMPSKKDGDISSEKDRKEAEESVISPNSVGFKLNKSLLEKLKEQSFSEDLLDKLQSISSKKYENKEMFLSAVESCLGVTLDEELKALLLKYAKYKKRNRKAKLPDTKIDREEVCPVDKSQLPADAIFKGHALKVVQDVIIRTDNVRFKRESYYSPSLKKTFLGRLPEGYKGDYGPNIVPQVISMKYISNMSIPKIHEWYQGIGIHISRSCISSILTGKHIDVFHREKAEIYETSLEISSFQQIDDTGSRVNGKNCYTQIVCNPLCTLFFTTERKDRLTVLDVLRNFRARSFIFNTESFELFEKLKVSKSNISLMHKFEQNVSFDDQRMQEILKEIFPDPNKGQRNRVRVMEACAISCYHQEESIPVVKLLLSDDAPQFKLITENLALCWVHEGRHYRRLSPLYEPYREQLELFLKSFWAYYGKLFAYKQNPIKERAEILSAEFDKLFSTRTEYEQLNERIAKTKNKKDSLLLVLEYSEIPLHNNGSENGARVQKRRADVSLQTKNEKGTEAQNSLMSNVETSKKLLVNAYEFVKDRVFGSFEIPPLSELMRRKAFGPEHEN